MVTHERGGELVVSVDLDVCQNYGQCVFEAPDVFDLDENDQLVYISDPPTGRRRQVEAAASACPVQAITLRG